MFVRSDDGALVDAASSEGQAIASRAAMRAELARAASERTKTLDTGDGPGNGDSANGASSGGVTSPPAAPAADTGPLPSPAVEAEHPELVWRCRVAVGQNTWHVVSATEPRATLDDRGRLAGMQWEPMAIPQSDTVLYLDWSAVSGFAFREETSPRALRRLFGIPEPAKPQPEENPRCVLIRCPTCHADNAYSRRRCRECEGPLTVAKRAHVTAQRRAARAAEGAPAPKPKAKAKRRSRARPPDLKQCRECGATFERKGALKKLGRCPGCNSIEGWA